MKIVHIGVDDGHSPFCLTARNTGHALLGVKLPTVSYSSPCIQYDGCLALNEEVCLYCQRAYTEMHKRPAPSFRYRIIELPQCIGTANSKCEDLDG